MKKILTACLFLASFEFAFSQTAYRSASNPHYWKNRPPFPGYWQQDVHYKIFAKIDEKTDIISGQEEIIYYNNSPDTLHFLYFHLYQNAFQPESYFDKMTKENGITPRYGKYESQKKNTEVTKVRLNNHGNVKTETDNTLMKVFLNKPLLPNDSVLVHVFFNTYFDSGTQRRRMKIFNTYGFKHYDGVHWYPRIAVYDRKFGWNTDQHMEKEFYGNFGTYEVHLNFANNYIVEATGELQNRQEVLPDELRKKLDIANFKDKPMFSYPSVIIPYDTSENSRKTWKYYAINVHDFAFTADPTYRIGEVTVKLPSPKGEGLGGEVKCIALAQESVASRWQNAAEYTAKIIQTFSEDFGMYIYPKMIVADARDGMEYPMLTLDGGWDPHYRDLFAHEIGHNWFFGMVGSNETYRAFMDEGFTQFLTCWALEKIDGKVRVSDPPASDYVRKHLRTDYVRNSEVYLPYMMDAVKGEDTRLNRHSNDFETALRHGGGYRQVYFKTAVMLYNLQYVLGDELFLQAMKHYTEQWKLCHPYPEDFRNSIIQSSKVDLNWFFDQWLETSKTIDYSIQSVKQTGWGEFKITFRRTGEMQMPLDFIVIDKKDSVYKFHIPNTWFVKKTDGTILPKWFGWGKIQPTYEAILKIPNGIKEVIIDPSLRLADVNMRDNRSTGNTGYYFDSKISNPPDWTKYELYARPDAWYNSYDGLKGGFHVNGNFMDYHDVFDATFWVNSGFGQGSIDTSVSKNDFDDVSFSAGYHTAADKLVRRSSVFVSVKYLDGLKFLQEGFEIRGKDSRRKFRLSLTAMIRDKKEDLIYLLFPNEWEAGKQNSFLSLGWEGNKNTAKRNSRTLVDLRASALTDDYDYSRLSFTFLNKYRLGRFNLHTRTFLQFGYGKSTPKESALFLAGANPEEMMDDKFTRSRGFFPDEWMGYGATPNHFHYGGGLNLRGYAGYLVPQEDENGNIKFTYRGNSGAALNAELEFDQIFRFIRITDQNALVKWIQRTFKLNTYLFGDIGMINYNAPGQEIKLADVRADAGAGAALTIKRWGPLQTVNPLTFRFDMPLFLNRIPAAETEYFKFRWMVGVSRAF